ncbi:MAG: hypothetical protein AB1Z67_11100 [Candidatus Limnocylindrales bacterium]
MRKLARSAVLLAAGLTLARLAAIVVSKRYEEGSEVSDEFRRTAVLGGLEFTSRARGLRSAEVGVVLGGARVDLRHATLDPAGATVLLENVLGGVELLVRADWSVAVQDTLVGGDTRIEVTPPTDLPDDAPRLDVHVVTRFGATAIKADAAGATPA